MSHKEKDESKLKKEKEIFTFHRYKARQGLKRERHPKLIVDYYNGEYGHMGLTKEPKKGKHHKNIPLTVNPNRSLHKQNKISKSYLRKKIEYDTEDKFYDQRLSNYKLSNEDKIYISDYVKRHKKR